MDMRKVFYALGLAQRAGKLASGDFALKSALKGHTATLLLVAADTAPNSKKEILYLAKEANVPVLELATVNELGACIGKGKRAAIAVLDPGFAKMIKKNYEDIK